MAKELTSAQLIRWSGLGGMAGGLLWFGLGRLGGAAWHRPILTLTYEDYNKLMPIPLLLLFVGLAGFFAHYGRGKGWLGSGGFAVAATGLGLMLIGNLVEFYWGGGIRHGDETISHAGWTLFLAGILLLTVGLLLFGIAILRAKALVGWWKALPLIIGLLLTLGIVLGLVMGEKGFMLVPVSIALGWVLLGYAVWFDKGTRQAGKTLTG
ncbi:MAG: hypothetical protein L0387_34560 [Acidobacteria bacterium]|nr:hypothetical protein [Acidobacteriota bacterium]